LAIFFLFPRLTDGVCHYVCCGLSTRFCDLLILANLQLSYRDKGIFGKVLTFKVDLCSLMTGTIVVFEVQRRIAVLSVRLHRWTRLIGIVSKGKG